MNDMNDMSGFRRWMMTMSAAQSFIHVSPVKKNVGSLVGKSVLKLKIQLSKFPGFIGHCSNRINRRINQDSYSINLINNRIFSPTPLLNMSIFDGHGGSNTRISNLLAENLHNVLATDESNSLSRDTFFDLLHDYKNLIGGEYWKSLYMDRSQYYNRFIKNCNTKEELILFDSENFGSRMLFDKSGNLIDKTSLLNELQRLKIINSYLKFDLEKCCGIDTDNITSRNDIDFNKLNELHPGGSTASSILITEFDSMDSPSTDDQSFFINPRGLLKLIVTQVGDSKILICDSNGIAHNLSKPHHPEEKREFRRLIKNSKDDGLITKDSFGEERFLNNYANTRSFGDIIGKQDGISAEPDIYSFLIGNTLQLPHSEKSKLQFGGDECFIVMVTDGVSDLLTDQEITDVITSTVNLRGLKHATPQFVAEEVIKFIMTIGDKHADNATCLVLRLPNWGNWPIIDRTGAAREQKLFRAF